MVSKHTRVSKRMLFTWFMLGGLILLFAPQGLTNKMQLGFERVFRLPLSVGRDFALTAKREEMLSDTVPRKDYDELQNHFNNLEATLRRVQERYKKLYGLYTDPLWSGTDFALAKVIAANIKGTGNELTIQYSRKAPLVQGQFVLNNKAIIGRISDAASGTAHVKLFTDPKSAIPVKIGKLDVLMLLKGNGDGSASIPLVSTEYKIKVGDIIYASDTGTGFLDAPVVIGRISRCVENRKKPLIWDITVEPACDIEGLVDVVVIIKKPQK